MKTAITPTRSENFSQWYQNLIVAADLAENAPVRGCMTIKPYGWAIWELMQEELNKRIKSVGVQNAQFPLLIPVEFLAREAEHVEGFAKESAVVTHYRLRMINGKLVPDPDSELAEPYIIRPTSETIIGEAMSRWIESYRDLPMKLNQWVNVMRWEMRTRIFLRTSEFYWQEGHNVFATAVEAKEDALKMHKLYTDYITENLAIESIIGEKTADERFAGADHTYTREHIMQDGKALQVGTSHDLGQHFSKAFNIKYLGKDGKQEYAYTTSWGITSRMIGSLIMSHGDDDGLILPPAIAPYQVVIIPIMAEQNEYAKKVSEKLKGIRVLVDDSDARSSDKMWKWIKRGVPVRIEIGAKEVESNSITLTRRDIGKDSKETIPLNEISTENMNKLLSMIQNDMLEKSRAQNKQMIHNIESVSDLKSALEKDVIGFFRIKYEKTLSPEFETLIDEYKVSRRCLDESDPTFVFVAKSY